MEITQCFIESHNLPDVLLTNVEKIGIYTNVCIAKHSRPEEDFDIEMWHKIVGSNMVSDCLIKLAKGIYV